MREDSDIKITISSGDQSVTTTVDRLDQATKAIPKIWVRKVKVKAKRVRIEYNVGTDLEEFDDMVFTTMNPKDFAVDEFYTAFDRLAEFVPRICEMDEKYGRGMKTLGVSISYPTDSKVMGACITVSKDLSSNDAPLILTTPFKASDVYHDDGNDMILLPPACSLAIDILIDRAKEFIGGLRAPEEQEELFASEATE